MTATATYRTSKDDVRNSLDLPTDVCDYIYEFINFKGVKTITVLEYDEYSWNTKVVIHKHDHHDRLSVTTAPSQAKYHEEGIRCKEERSYKVVVEYYAGVDSMEPYTGSVIRYHEFGNYRDMTQDVKKDYHKHVLNSKSFKSPNLVKVYNVPRWRLAKEYKISKFVVKHLTN